MKGIDVSENNGHIDWKVIKDAGIEFAIIRSSYGKNSVDSMFLQNVAEAQARGIKCGAYHYGYALTPEDAKREAENCRRYIEETGVLLTMPVFYDVEDADGYKKRHGFNFSRSNITNICKAFIDNIKLNTGIYASEDWLDNCIDWKSLNCPVWNAAWGRVPVSSFAEANGNIDGIKAYLWQFTDRLIIGGKEFDGNIMYDNKHKAGQIGY